MSTYHEISTKPAVLEQTDTVVMAGHTIVSRVLAGYSGPVAVRLWDGRLAAGRRNAPCTVVFRDPGALRELVLHPDLLRLAEAHLAGAVEVEGDLEALFDLSDYLTQLRLSLATRLRLLGCAWRLPRESVKELKHVDRAIGPGVTIRAPALRITITWAMTFTGCGSIRSMCIPAPISAMPDSPWQKRNTTSWTISVGSCAWHPVKDYWTSGVAGAHYSFGRHDTMAYRRMASRSVCSSITWRASVFARKVLATS